MVDAERGRSFRTGHISKNTPRTSKQLIMSTFKKKKNSKSWGDQFRRYVSPLALDIVKIRGLFYAFLQVLKCPWHPLKCKRTKAETNEI